MPVVSRTESNAGISNTLNGWRICLFVALTLFLNLQLDGLPLGHNPAHLQLLLLPITIGFCFVLFRLLWPPAAFVRDSDGALKRIAHAFVQPRVLLGVSTALFAGTAALFFVESRYYARIGYQLHAMVTALVFLTAILLLAGNACRRTGILLAPAKRTSLVLLITVLGSFVAVSLLSIWSFPLTARRSDMLPLLVEAGRSLIAHQDPYHAYQFVTGSIYFTYLPGTLLAFLPAVALHADVRLMNVVFVLLLAVLVYRETKPAFRSQAVALVAIFLLAPYLLYRHEIYTEPHWLLIVGSILLLQRKRDLSASVLFGFSITVSQFSWVLFPFFLLYLLQSAGVKSAIRAAGAATLAAGSIVLPFMALSPHMVYGVLSHWKEMGANARPINFSWVASEVIGRPHLSVLQLVLLAGIFGYCALTGSCRDLPGCLRWMTVALTAFILCNFLVWGYFFLLMELLLILYILSANGWLRSTCKPGLDIDI